MLSLSVGTAQLIPGTQERREAAQELYPDLAQKLENPLARIIVAPLNFRYEEGSGPEERGSRFASNFAPQIPFILGNRWHMLSKTDISWIHQKDVITLGTQEGWSDLAQTFFFTPKHPLGWDSYWGIGSTVVFPTASKDELGSDKYSAGPTLAVYRQKEGWTAGILLNHVWDFAGDDDALDVSASLIEPTLTYTFDTGTTVGFNAEFKHDLERNAWVAPLEFRLGQLTLIRNHPVKFGIAYNHFILDDNNAAEWGVEFQITVPLEAPEWGLFKKESKW